MINDKYNIQNLHNTRKQQLFDKIKSNILWNFHQSHNEPNNTEIMIKWIIETLTSNNDLLGLTYWSLYQYQNKEYKQSVVNYFFHIKQTFNGITLSDDDFDDLINIAKISKFSQDDFISTSQLYKDFSNKTIKQFYATRDILIYICKYKNTDMIDAIIFFNLLYIPFSRTYLLCLKQDEEDGTPYFFNRLIGYDYPSGTHGYFFSPDNKNQYLVRLPYVTDYIQFK
jgi:hypothetical protein